MNTDEIINKIRSEEFDFLLKGLYSDHSRFDYERSRYKAAVELFCKYYGEGEAMIVNAPGRTELCGNHTDHQHGQVLAASINLDAVAVIRANGSDTVRLRSQSPEEIVTDLSDLSIHDAEAGTTQALIRGVAAGLKERGFKIGGFDAVLTSEVLIGAGLSSSAAFESVIGTAFSALFNADPIPYEAVALAGQYAENRYFKKPCGLMDQLACSCGGLVHIDFADPGKPAVKRLSLELEKYGYCLCITDTKGSHADLTEEYAAIPREMHEAASFFGKDFLNDVSSEELLGNIPALMKAAGGRAVLRALHFEEENKRVAKAFSAIEDRDIEQFLDIVAASGNSSFKYLQNVYVPSDPQNRNAAVALALSEIVLGPDGVSRIHGGGFAGTIQAFVKDSASERYRKAMDDVFGDGSCRILRIRQYGGIRIL